MSKYTIYHNPRCSKSRQTLALLRENNIEPNIELYMDSPPSKKRLKELLSMLGGDIATMLRNKEDAYKKLKLKDASVDKVLSAMTKEPKLIERPIVVKGKKAVMGRPPENVKALF